MNEVYTDLEKPGMGGEKFIIKLDKDFELVFGEDIEICGEPERTKDGWTYAFKDISGKLSKYLKTKRK